MSDILKLWPAEQKTNLHSTKWMERKESLQHLLEIIETSPSLTFHRGYDEIFDDLKKIIRKDLNVNVVAEAMKVLTAAIETFPNELRSSIPGFAPLCFEKLKEKKAVIREPLVKCVDVLISTCGLANMGKAFLEVWQKPSAEIKIELMLAIYRNLNEYRANDPIPMDFIKQISQSMVKFSEDADPKVRDATLHALAAVQRLYGKEVLFTLVGAGIRDNAHKTSKIDSYAEKAAEEAEKAAQKRSCVTGGSNEDPEDDGAVNNVVDCDNGPSVSNIDPWELLTPVDISTLLPSNFYEDVVSKKWSERRDALDALLKGLEENKRLEPSPQHYNELVSILKKIIEKDSNINVVVLAVKVLNGLAEGLRTAFEPFVMVCGPAFLKFKEKKTNVRDCLLEYIQTVFLFVHLEKAAECIKGGLTSQNPNVRKETCTFLKNYFLKHSSATLKYDITSEFREDLLKLVDDGDGAVRESAMEAIAALTRCVGLEFAEKKIFSVFGNEAIKVKKITDFYTTYNTEHGSQVDVHIKKLYGNNSTAAKPKPKSAPSNPKRAPPSSAGSTCKVTRVKPAAHQRPATSTATYTVKKQISSSNDTTRRVPPKVAPAQPAPSSDIAPRIAKNRPATPRNVPTPRPVQPTRPLAVGSTRPQTSSAMHGVNTARRVTPVRPNITSKSIVNKPATPQIASTTVNKISLPRSTTAVSGIKKSAPLVAPGFARARTQENLRPVSARPGLTAGSARPQTGSGIPLPRSFRSNAVRSSSSTTVAEQNPTGK
uniref:TOG domain-containing protein n=1 Tax=Steinernema glaseri TaxID=37863 RepID=A0A1I7Y1I0_9BILA